MPYSRARYWMLGVIAVILVGFWPSYWTHIGKVPWQFHAHGAAASLWVTMVTVQCWTSQSKKQLELHRQIGAAAGLSLYLFLIAGLAAILDVSAKGMVNNEPVRVCSAPPSSSA